jgi:aspartyl-tRNA(Asn)/glutamyl-tRNA(Gln) amidotransferase subunit A
LFEFSSIEQYHVQLKRGDVSCRQAVEHFLKQISSSKYLNAFIEVYTEEALKRASDLDKKRSSNQPIGLLHGVVIGLKDIIAHKDHRLTASSKILEGFTSIYSATATERLLREEAIIIGRCNCDEFGMGSTNENSAHRKV